MAVQMSEALAQQIVADVTANNFQLKVAAEVRVVVPTGFIRTKVDVHCEITVDALEVLKDPAAVIRKKECTYSYSF